MLDEKTLRTECCDRVVDSGCRKRYGRLVHRFAVDESIRSSG